MSTLITGSVAVDHIMAFHGRFQDIILPDKIHMLNVAFHVPSLKKTFGGCAANIGYSLKQLGGNPLIAATVGSDFSAYAAWLDKNGIRRDYIRELPGESTAGAYITTDTDDNQIIGFHSGAMDRAHEMTLSEIAEELSLGIVSPNGKQAMLDYARELKRRKIYTVVDPGQGLPQFSSEELVELIDGADTYIVNSYEWELTLERSGLTEEEIRDRVKNTVVTLGENGARAYEDGRSLSIPSVEPDGVVDPTGCGDSFRAGYLFGIERGLSFKECLQLGSVMGSFMVEQEGTQTFEVGIDGITERYERAFGSLHV